MREPNRLRPGTGIGDEAIDGVARTLMARQPAAGLGRRVVAQIADTGANGRRPVPLVWATRAAAACAVIAVAVSVWYAGRPGQAPGPVLPRDATSPPAAAVAEPAPAAVPGALASDAAATAHATTTSDRHAARRADRLWASRPAPEAERLVVAPVADPEPLTVEPLDVPGMALAGISVDPLAVEALTSDQRPFPQ